jgi:oxygen-dependent protoporphyrinogen oxidase
MSASGANVIVVGSGASGLAAAFRLHQAGHTVTVLEAQDRIGGKIRTGHRDGFTYEEGAVILPAAYTSMLKIVAEAGLGDDLVAGGSVVGFAAPGPAGHDGAELFYLDSAHLIRDAIRTKMLSTGSKLRLAKLFRDNLKIKSKLNYEDLSSCAGFDTETAAQYARRRGLGEQAFTYVIDATLRGVLGANAEQASVVDFFFAFNNLLGTKLYGLRGGLSRYPETLAKLFPIHTQARVASVLDRGGDVEVVWRDNCGGEHTEHVDGVIVAIPGDEAAAILPALDSARADYLRGLDYTQTLSVTVALSAPPADVPAFVMQVPEAVHHGLLGFILEHNRVPAHVPEGKGLLGLLTMPAWSGELIHADDHTVVHETLAAAHRVLPGITDTVEWTQINRWDSALIHTHPGSWRELDRFNHVRKTTDRRIQLAGDYFSSTNLNTATTSGERAARELVSRL